MKTILGVSSIAKLSYKYSLTDSAADNLPPIIAELSAGSVKKLLIYFIIT